MIQSSRDGLTSAAQTGAVHAMLLLTTSALVPQAAWAQATQAHRTGRADFVDLLRHRQDLSVRRTLRASEAVLQKRLDQLESSHPALPRRAATHQAVIDRVGGILDALRLRTQAPVPTVAQIQQARERRIIIAREEQVASRLQLLRTLAHRDPSLARLVDRLIGQREAQMLRFETRLEAIERRAGTPSAPSSNFSRPPADR